MPSGFDPVIIGDYVCRCFYRMLNALDPLRYIGHIYLVLLPFKQSKGLRTYDVCESNKDVRMSCTEILHVCVCRLRSMVRRCMELI